MWLTKIFSAAIPDLTTRSVGPLASLNDPDKGVTPQESTALIIKNYQGLKDDLQVLNKLMHIARNLLVTTEPELPQDLCAAAQFDQMVYQTIILCVNVTSKGYDGEVLDENSRQRLNEITELCKFSHRRVLADRPPDVLGRQESPGHFVAAGTQLDRQERPEQDVVLV